MATVYEQSLANLSKDLGIQSINAPQLSSNPFGSLLGDPSSSLSSSMGIPQGVGMSGEASTPIGNGSAQNSAQSAMKEKSNLQKAFEGVQSLYDPMGGVPIRGSEDVRVKSDVYGRPYTVVSMTPTDEQGRSQKAETMSFGITDQQKAGTAQESQQSKDNRSTYVQSVINSYLPQVAQQKAAVQQQQQSSNQSTTPTGAVVSEQNTPTGTSRTVTGPNGNVVTATTPKKKEAQTA
jgi:hypothetical protein